MNGRFIVGFFGKAGSGKTEKIREVLPYVPRPVFILDSQNEFVEGLQFDSGYDLLDYLREGRPNLSGVYILNATKDEDYDLFFRILATAQDPATVVIDEADLFSNPYNINDDLSRIIKYGRHWQQNIIYAARRPAEVNRNLTAQSNCLVSFKQTEPRDIATLKQSYVEAEKLSDLDADRYEFLVLGDCSRVPFSEILAPGLTNTVPKAKLAPEPQQDPGQPGDTTLNAQ